MKHKISLLFLTCALMGASCLPKRPHVEEKPVARNTGEGIQDSASHTAADTFDLNDAKKASTADSFIESGRNKLEQENFQGAQQDFSKAIELDPANENAYFERAQLNYDLKNYQAAQGDAATLLRLNPDHVAGNFLSGEVKFAMKDYSGAIQDFSVVIDNTPEDVIAFYRRGLARSAAGDHTGALQDYNVVLNGNEYFEGLTEYAAGYISRGNTYNKLKMVPNACADWQKALSLGDESANELLKKHCK